MEQWHTVEDVFVKSQGCLFEYFLSLRFDLHLRAELGICWGKTLLIAKESIITALDTTLTS